MPRPFNGKINVDVRDSVPDWDPYMPPRAPEGSPNILIVLYDDTGMASWEPFGQAQGARRGVVRGGG